MTTLIKLGKFVQTPDEKKRYTFDYSEWLDVGETITDTASEIDNATIPPLEVDSLTHDNTLATWYVAGGKHLENYTVIIKITTSAGQIKEDAITIKVKDYTP